MQVLFGEHQVDCLLLMFLGSSIVSSPGATTVPTTVGTRFRAPKDYVTCRQ